MPCITNADDAKLAALIGAAKKRVLLLAPGTSEPVARALAAAWERLGGPAVSVILDVDPEVCRLPESSAKTTRRLQSKNDTRIFRDFCDSFLAANISGC